VSRHRPVLRFLIRQLERWITMLRQMEQDTDDRPTGLARIECPHCGVGTRLEFQPGVLSSWAQCRCGYGWDMPDPSASRMVN